MFGLGEIFTLLFVTLGPVKLLGPFVQETNKFDAATVRAIALRAFLIGLIAVVIGGYLGTVLASHWGISVAAIEIATGLIFLLVAMGVVMAPYQAAQVAVQASALPPASPALIALRLTFPAVVTPYGVAAVIALLTVVSDQRTTIAVYSLLIVIMILNLLAMLYARQIMRGVVLLILQVLGAVLGVLQVGLAVQIIIRGLRDLHVLPE